jgi:hypothetical protein
MKSDQIEQLAELAAEFKATVECHLSCLAAMSPSELEALMGVPMVGVKDAKRGIQFTRSDRESAMLKWFDNVDPVLGLQIRNMTGSCEFGSSRLPVMNKVFVAKLPPSLEQYLEAAAPRQLGISVDRIPMAALTLIAYKDARDAGEAKPDARAVANRGAELLIHDEIYKVLSWAEELTLKDEVSLAGMGVFLRELNKFYKASYID